MVMGAKLQRDKRETSIMDKDETCSSPGACAMSGVQIGAVVVSAAEAPKGSCCCSAVDTLSGGSTEMAVEEQKPAESLKPVEEQNPVESSAASLQISQALLHHMSSGLVVSSKIDLNHLIDTPGSFQHLGLIL